jgi:hypothetical protein
MSQMRDLFTHDGTRTFEEGMSHWDSFMMYTFNAMSQLQHFSLNLAWPKGGLNRLQPSGDMYWGELLRQLGHWLGAMNHSLTSVALEGQAGLALTAPFGARPFAQLKSLVIGDCHWQNLLQIAQCGNQLSELVLLVEGEASGGTHISHEWTMPHLLSNGGGGGGQGGGNLHGPLPGGMAFGEDLGPFWWPPRSNSGNMNPAMGTRSRGEQRTNGLTIRPLLQNHRSCLKRFACVLDDKRAALKLGQLGLWGCEALESLVLCLPDAVNLPEELGGLCRLTELVVRLPDSKHQVGLQIPKVSWD